MSTNHGRITIELDAEQLDILMSQIEAMYESHGDRGRSADALRENLEYAAATWDPANDGSFAYSLARVAPVYRRMLTVWERLQLKPQVAWHTDNLFTFVEALRTARADSAPSRDLA